MRNFRQGNRHNSSGFGRRSDRGNRGRSSFGRRNEDERSFGRDERRSVNMHDAICSKCKKQCQVPFRPTGSKPVFCSDCFRQNEDYRSGFAPRNQDKHLQSGISSEQLNQINAKLDKILLVLQDLEIDVDDDEDSESD